MHVYYLIKWLDQKYKKHCEIAQQPALENVSGLWSGRRCCPFYRSRPVFFLVFHICIKHTYIAVSLCRARALSLSLYTHTHTHTHIECFFLKEEQEQRQTLLFSAWIRNDVKEETKKTSSPLPPKERCWRPQLPTKLFFYTFWEIKKKTMPLAVPSPAYKPVCQASRSLSFSF